MLIVLSPAKSLDFTTAPHVRRYSQPQWLDHSAELIADLKQLSPVQVAELMAISDKLAVLNVGRFGDWQPPFTPENAKQAVLAFDGDVYDGLAAKTLSAEDLDFAQDHLAILSGLYGLLKPLDLIQPYRLEMGTRFANPRGKDLYAFWGGRLADAINGQLDADPSPVLINLASEEYFKAVGEARIRHRVITPVFEDYKGGRYKIISFFAKKARGLMSRYLITRRLLDPEALKEFDVDGYAYSPAASEGDRWVFRRSV